MDRQFQQTPQSEPSDGVNPTEAWFATTHWSVVLAAGEQKSALAGEALDALCRSYFTGISPLPDPLPTPPSWGEGEDPARPASSRL